MKRYMKVPLNQLLRRSHQKGLKKALSKRKIYDKVYLTKTFLLRGCQNEENNY